MPRTRGTNQRAELRTIDLDTLEQTLVYSSTHLLFEAPNWTTDGKSLIVNGDGGLFRIGADGGELDRIDLGGVPPINNDHVLSPDGSTAYVSSEDGHLYAISLTGGPTRRVSNDHDAFTHYLHGISPDGSTLTYIGMDKLAGGGVRTNVYVIPASGGEDEQITDDDFADDGSEFGPDSRWIYFNSERASNQAGHAQLFRTDRQGARIEQLTFDERVNWFPHVSPLGNTIVYVSFPPGTLGHPADVEVILRRLDLGEDEQPSGRPRDVVTVFGGQGTMNVPSWDPVGRRIAFVDYPVG